MAAKKQPVSDWQEMLSVIRDFNAMTVKPRNLAADTHKKIRAGRAREYLLGARHANGSVKKTRYQMLREAKSKERP